MSRAFILLGSNLGDRRALLESAVNNLKNRAGRLVAASSLYETEPSGFISDDKFLNQVIEIETDMFPEELLDTLLLIEKELGRMRYSDKPEYDASGNRIYRSRVIDLDMLLYDDKVISTEKLEIPHPRMCKRAFTMVPLKEIAPETVIPGTGRSVSDIADNDFSIKELKEVVRL